MAITRCFSLFLLLFVISTASAQTPCPFAAPALVSPADGAVHVTTPVTFTWSAVEGSLAYEVWASHDGGDFERLESTRETRLFDDIPPSASVEWYVVAIFTTCSSRSISARFTTGDCDPPAAELVAPADGALLGSPITFSWSDVEEADGHRLWIDQRVAAETGNTEARTHLAPGRHEWFVESFFTDCGSSFSPARTFEVQSASNCLNVVATLLSPADGSTNALRDVSFSWTEVPGAIGYELRAALGDGALEFIDQTTETFTSARLAVGNITWVVIAQLNGCRDIASDPSRFTIPFNPNCDNSQPFLISPVNDADDVPTRVDFIWTAVAGAKRYNVRVYTDEGEGDATLVGSTTTTRLNADVQVGELAWVVEAEFEGCPTEVSPMFYFDTAEPGPCRLPAAPEIFLGPRALSGDETRLIWSARLYASSYEVQEATREDFSNALSTTTTDILLTFNREVNETTRYFYRVRATSNCGLSAGPWSEVASMVITPKVTAAADRTVDLATPLGQQRVVVQKVRVPGADSPQAFTARMDKTWLRVEPSSGTIPISGIELTITADPRNLPVGSNSGTLILEYPANAARPRLSVPVSVSLATPVTPNAGTSPLPSSLIIPAVAHADSIGARVESDIRLANASAQIMKYLLLFTPTGRDGTRAGQQATIQVGAGQTTALNDVLKNVFGYASSADSISGVLEIRALSVNHTATDRHADRLTSTFVSSRTFARGATGTYGQSIPAIPYSRFIGGNGSTLSLLPVTQSAFYRTEVGLVEGSGEPATVQLSIFGDAGQRMGDYNVALKAGEQMQLGAFLLQHGVSVEAGRIEVAVTSRTGKVTAYASVVDTRTDDSMLIPPVDTQKIAASRYVLPGIAHFEGRWRSDVRVFNAGNRQTSATFTFYPQGNPAGSRIVTRILAAGQMLVIDNALQSLFNVTGSGGSLVITTPMASQLVATARTFTGSDQGTYGQFIPAVTADDGVIRGERALQILHVEESARFRTNVGIVELTGSSVTVEISVFSPDSKLATAVTRMELQGNEFRQIDSILPSFGLAATYNARVTLKVVAGNGRISGYASLIDNGTNDGTFIPAQ